MAKLIKSFVEKITEPGDYRDSELPGFVLRVSRSSTGSISRRYLINTKIKGSRRNVSISLGTHGVNITAEQARTRAREELHLLRQGVHPNEIRKESSKAEAAERARQQAEEQIDQLTLQKLLEDYVATHTLKPRTAKSYGLVIRRCLSDWLDLPIKNISKPMVHGRQLKLTTEHPAQANLTMRILRALFSYAKHAYTDADGKPILTTNPVETLRELRAWNRVPRRQRLILPHQLEDWYKAVVELENTSARDLLLLEIFTGLRQYEASSLRWSNIDFKAKTLKVEDTKNHSDHLLPLSDFLFWLLQTRWNERDQANQFSDKFVFPSPKSSASGHVISIRDSIDRVRKESGLQFSEHDLRRTFETCAESLDISAYTLKKLLNHRTNDVTAGYIVTTAERLRGAMQTITDYLVEQMHMPPFADDDSQNVLHLPKRGPRKQTEK